MADSERRAPVSDKLKGYGEGVVHGWEAAAEQVENLTNGLFTLKEPREVAAWRERLKRPDFKEPK